MYFIFLYENRAVSPTEMILSSGEGDEEEGGSDELNHCAL
jgi:hypothetical protein